VFLQDLLVFLEVHSLFLEDLLVFLEVHSVFRKARSREPAERSFQSPRKEQGLQLLRSILVTPSSAPSPLVVPMLGCRSASTPAASHAAVSRR
jgi:hypothetical protein